MEAGKHVLCNDYYENYHKFKLHPGEVLFQTVVILDSLREFRVKA